MRGGDVAFAPGKGANRSSSIVAPKSSTRWSRIFRGTGDAARASGPKGERSVAAATTFVEASS
jgi:hypothetical protein